MIVRGVIDVDEYEVPKFIGRTAQRSVGVTLSHAKAYVLKKLGGEWNETILQKADHSGEDLDHLDPLNSIRMERGGGRISKPKPSHENRQLRPRVSCEGLICECSLGDGVVAAHQ